MSEPLIKEASTLLRSLAPRDDLLQATTNSTNSIMKEEEARTVDNRKERAAKRQMPWAMYQSLELASRGWRTYLGLLIMLALRDWARP